ncbi:MAG: Slp family lipoprotein [Nitrospiraceae bacterium]
MTHDHDLDKLSYCGRRWAGLLLLSLLCAAFGCSTALPSKYVRQAEPDVTLTALVTHPERYRGKVVVLGGTIVEETLDGDRLLLHMKNRPLDEDYHPHRPAVVDGPEAGYYWIVASPEKIAKTYRNWARATVVGQVVGVKAAAGQTASIDEPVLAAMYMRGWGGSDHKDAWEDFEDPNYRVRSPGGIHGEFEN